MAVGVLQVIIYETGRPPLMAVGTLIVGYGPYAVYLNSPPLDGVHDCAGENCTTPIPNTVNTACLHRPVSSVTNDRGYLPEIVAAIPVVLVPTVCSLQLRLEREWVATLLECESTPAK